MGPDTALPLPVGYLDIEEYVAALLSFVSSSKMLQNLCGGVHILDFFTRDPSLYNSLLDEEWRTWFELHDLEDLLDFVLREDMTQFTSSDTTSNVWRGERSPPSSLVEYLLTIRRLSLNRECRLPGTKEFNGTAVDGIPRHIAVGMRIKKIHEVDRFARYVQKLTADLAATQTYKITHLVDFGSGQNYLGRTLASPPYDKHIVAVESKHHNIEGAKVLDIHAKIAPKRVNWVNKKLWRTQLEMAGQSNKSDSGLKASESEHPINQTPPDLTSDSVGDDVGTPRSSKAKLDISATGHGSIQYVEYRLEDGNLATVVDEIVDERLDESASAMKDCELPATPASSIFAVRARDPSLMVMSIHSCGNLSHHGLRSLTMNPAVNAVAIVGCCYNLVTERLTPPSFKHPSLRQHQPTQIPGYWRDGPPTVGDPHGFPMSSRIVNYPTPILFNITARMMAVQAPQNWGPEDSNDFFTRHFYRAMLQKVFLDRGIVELPSVEDGVEEAWKDPTVSGSVPSKAAASKPVIIGRLGKSCYRSFVTYVRGVLTKVLKDPDRGKFFEEKLGGITDAETQHYADEFAPRKKDVSIVWTLMAYSAGLVEAVMVVDRWLWLKEQENVTEAWVEAVFDYKHSPRNLVVVGIKKQQKSKIADTDL